MKYPKLIICGIDDLLKKNQVTCYNQFLLGTGSQNGARSTPRLIRNSLLRSKTKKLKVLTRGGATTHQQSKKLLGGCRTLPRCMLCLSTFWWGPRS